MGMLLAQGAPGPPPSFHGCEPDVFQGLITEYGQPTQPVKFTPALNIWSLSDIDMVELLI